MKCEKCGMELQTLMVDMFDIDGSDYFLAHPIEECEEDAVVLETRKEWTGYGLSEEEMIETIECPHCRKFPFKHKEVQVYEIVRVVCFKTGDEQEGEDTNETADYEKF